jgi:hypothetical protein
MTVIDSFTFVTRSPNWFKKVLLGSIITAVPFFGSAISNGYQMEVFRNLLANSPDPLPEWKDVGKFSTSGLRLLLAIYVLYIPSTILSAIGWILGFSRILTIGMMLYDVDYQTRMGVNVGAYIGREIVALLLGLILGLILPIAFFFVPAMMRRCAKYDSAFAALNFPAHFGFIFRHLGNYLMAYIAVLIALFLFSTVSGMIGTATLAIVGLGALLGWIGLAMGRFWTRLMWAYNLAQMETEEFAHEKRDEISYQQPAAPFVVGNRPYRKTSYAGLILAIAFIAVIFSVIGVAVIVAAALILSNNYQGEIASSNRHFNANTTSNINANRPLQSNINLNANIRTPTNGNTNTVYSGNSSNSNAVYYGSNSNSNYTSPKMNANTSYYGYYNGCVLKDRISVVTDDDDVLQTMMRGDSVHIISAAVDDDWYKVETRAGVTGWIDARYVVRISCDQAVGNSNYDKK